MTILVREASVLDTLSAFFLLVRNYVRMGYLTITPSVENFKKYRKILLNFLKKSDERDKTLVAKDGKRVVGTISYCVGEELPIESMFASELAQIRTQCPLLAYIGLFATSHEYSCTRLALRMMRDVEKKCIALGANGAVCVVNRTHVEFYTNQGFTEVAELPAMEGLTEKASAVLLMKTEHSRSRDRHTMQVA